MAIDRNGEFAGVFGVKLLTQTGCDRLLDVRVDLVALDILVAGNSVDDANQFLVHESSSSAI